MFGISVRLALAYLFDWIVVVLIAGGGAALTYITGYHRPFSLTDPTLAFPEKNDTVSIVVAGIVAFCIPALIIVLISLLLPPRPLPTSASTSTIWRRKIWNINAGLLGLALACAATLLVAAGLKDMIGKPRPDLLARCHPDVANIGDYIVGGFGTSLDSEASALVVSGICRQPDKHHLDDGFAAFPSGHSAFSWAGLLYFTLWLCCRFAIAIPYLGPNTPETDRKSEAATETLISSVRTRQAAPPVWLVVICLLPCGVALYICSSRYSDFHHAGWDILAGSLIGILFAWASFRMYHLPIRRGMGTSWAARRPDHAFLAGSDAQDRSGIGSSSLMHGVGHPVSRQDEEAAPPRRTETGESGVEMLPYADNRRDHYSRPL